MMAETEGFGEDSELLVASVVVKILLAFVNGADRTLTQAVAAGAAISGQRGICDKGKICKDGYQADSRSEGFGDQEVVPADPSDPGSPGHVFVGKMTSLVLPVHKLRSGNRYGLIPEALNGGVDNQSNRVQEDVDSLIMLEVKGRRLVLNPVHHGIGKVVSDGYGQGQLVDRRGWKKDVLFFESPKVGHAEKGTSPLLAECSQLFNMGLFGHVTSLLVFDLEILNLLPKRVSIDPQELGGGHLDVPHLFEGRGDKDLFNKGNDVIQKPQLRLRLHVGINLV